MVGCIAVGTYPCSRRSRIFLKRGPFCVKYGADGNLSLLGGHTPRQVVVFELEI